MVSIIATNGDASELVLRGVVVEQQPAIVEEPRERPIVEEPRERPHWLERSEGDGAVRISGHGEALGARPHHASHRTRVGFLFRSLRRVLRFDIDGSRALGQEQDG